MRSAFILVALATLAAGCGPARDAKTAATTPRPASIPPSEVTAEIEGATPKQEEVLREILAGLGRNTSIESVYVGKAAARQASSAEPAEDPRGEWEASLVAQDLAERSRDLELGGVRALVVKTAGGSVLDVTEEAGAPADTRKAVTADRLSASASSAARESEVALVETEILQPNRLAVAVKVRADDPARFLHDRAARFLSRVPSPWAARYDGLYVELVDAGGDLAWAAYWTVSDDGGGFESGYVRPDLQGCEPRRGVSGGRPFPRRPRPRCPLDSRVTPHRASTTIVGASAAQEKLLREILAGLAPTVIDRIRVKPAKGAGWASDDPHAVVLRVDYANTDEKERGYWEATLLGGVFDDRSQALHLPKVAAVERDGDGVALDGPDPPPPIDWLPVTRTEVTARIVAGAKASDAEIAELRILEPDHLAAAVVLRVADPARYLKYRLTRFLRAFPTEVELDGLYIRVVDRKGTFVWLSASTVSSAISGGSHMVRPDLAGCDPDPGFGEPMGYSPPPCPADNAS